jgi:hypothetical protein
MSDLKKILSPWISLIFNLVKYSMKKIALKNGRYERELVYSVKSIDGYYRSEGELFIWFQIIMTWSLFIWSFINLNLTPFLVGLCLWSFVTILKSLEYIEPDLINS